MQKQGFIILGIGGDNSNGGAGRFYEGVMANGAATFNSAIGRRSSRTDVPSPRANTAIASPGLAHSSR